MAHRFLRCVLITALSVSCSNSAELEPRKRTMVKQAVIDQKKFETLYRASKAVEGAIGVGVTYQEFGKLLQSFSTELSIANDRPRSPEEQQLVNRYTEALNVLVDSATVWKKKIQSSSDTWKGQILYKIVSNPVGKPSTDTELTPIIEKYGLETQNKSTYDVRFVSISPTSTQTLWTIAGKHLNEGNRLYFEEREVEVSSSLPAARGRTP
jgi:hypothetical protein